MKFIQITGLIILASGRVYSITLNTITSIFQGRGNNIDRQITFLKKSKYYYTFPLEFSNPVTKKVISKYKLILMKMKNNRSYLKMMQKYIEKAALDIK